MTLRELIDTLKLPISLTYENGVILSGECTIDGKTYVVHPETDKWRKKSIMVNSKTQVITLYNVSNLDEAYEMLFTTFLYYWHKESQNPFWDQLLDLYKNYKASSQQQQEKIAA